MPRPKSKAWTEPTGDILDVTDYVPKLEKIREKHIGDRGSVALNKAATDKLAIILGNMRLLKARQSKPSEASIKKALVDASKPLGQALAALGAMDDFTKSILVEVAGRHNAAAGLSFPLPASTYLPSAIIHAEDGVAFIEPHYGEASVEVALKAVAALQAWLLSAQGGLKDTGRGQAPKTRRHDHYAISATRTLLAGDGADGKTAATDEAIMALANDLRSLLEKAPKSATGIRKKILG